MIRYPGRAGSGQQAWAAAVCLFSSREVSKVRRGVMFDDTFLLFLFLGMDFSAASFWAREAFSAAAVYEIKRQTKELSAWFLLF